MNDNELHDLLASAAGAVRSDATRSHRALYAGRKRQRRLLATRLGSLVAVIAVIGSAASYVLSTPPAPAVVAAVACGATTPTSSTIRVAPTMAGLPLQVRNESSSVAQLTVDRQGAAVPPGVGELRLSVPPGRHQVTCTTATGQRTVTTLDVVDNLDVWSHGATVRCAYPRVYDETGEFLLGHGDPTALTRQWLSAQPGDAVTAVGYPAASQRLVAVRRGGRSVAVAAWHQLLPGTWTLGVVRICAGSVRPPTAGTAA